MNDLSPTIILIIATVAISLYADSKPEFKNKWLFHPYTIKRQKQWYRFLSSGFVHGGIPHLAFNMISLYFMGDLMNRIFIIKVAGNSFVEGTLFYLAMYIGAIIIGSLPAYFKHQDSPDYAALGASGGVSGVVIGVALALPLADFGLMFIPVPIKAFIFAALYMAYSYYQSKNANDNIGHDAHLYGALFGLVFTALSRPAFISEFITQISTWNPFG